MQIFAQPGLYGSSAAAGSEVMQQQQGLSSGVGVAMASPLQRGVLVLWLRAAVDVLAALLVVDPGAVLNETSHWLAAPAADSSSSLPLVMTAIGRVLHKPAEGSLLLPHLGFTAALAIQALDPARPQLRNAMTQPVAAVLRELTAAFPQVSCHNSTLQLAVGSTRSLGAPFKSNSSAGSIASTDSGVDLLWLAADGAAVGLVHGTSSGSDGSYRAAGIPAGAAVIGEVLQAAAVAVFDMNGGTKKKVLLLPVLMPIARQEADLAASHETAGIAGHWAPAGQAPSRGADSTPGGSSSGSLSHDGSSAVASTGMGMGPPLTNPGAVAASQAGSSPTAGGAWQLHAARSAHYTSTATWGEPWVSCQDVARGVAAVAFNPGGDAVAGFLEGCYCLVVWKLQSSWTQKPTTCSVGGAAGVKTRGQHYC
eukprot:gene13937-14055_t